MPSGEPSAAKTRLRGAMSAVRLATRATSRKRGEQEAGRAAGGAMAGPPSTISTGDQRQGMLQRVSSRRHAPASSSGGAAAAGAAQDPRGGRMPRRRSKSPTPLGKSSRTLSGALTASGRPSGGGASSNSRRNLMAGDDCHAHHQRLQQQQQRPRRSSGEHSCRNISNHSDAPGAEQGNSYGYGFGDDDEGTTKSSLGGGGGGQSVMSSTSSRLSSRRMIEQRQQQQQQAKMGRPQRRSAPTGAAGGPTHRRTRTEGEKECSHDLRGRLDQVKQRRAQATRDGSGRMADSITQRTAADRAGAHDRARYQNPHGSDSSLNYQHQAQKQQRRPSGGGARPSSRSRATSSGRERLGSGASDGRPSSRGRNVRRPSIGRLNTGGESLSRAGKMLQQTRRTSSASGRRLMDDDDDDDGKVVPKPVDQLAEARKAVDDVAQQREEMRGRIEELQQELKALDALYDENVKYLHKLEEGSSPKDATSLGTSAKPAPSARRDADKRGPSPRAANGSSSSGRHNSPEEKKSDVADSEKPKLEERRIQDDLDKSATSLSEPAKPAQAPAPAKKAADLSPDQVKALNKAKMTATQTVIKNTAMDEGSKRKKIQSINKIATDDSLDVEEKISMLNDIAAGKEPRQKKKKAPAAAPHPAAAPAQPSAKPTKPAAGKKAADLTPEQTKALNKAKMLATQAVIKNTTMDESDKRKKIQTINKINSDDSLDVEDRISMLGDIADGKDPVAPTARGPPPTKKSSKPAAKKKAADLTPEETKSLNRAKMLAVQSVIKDAKMGEDDKRKKIQLINSITGHEYLDVSDKINKLNDLAAGKEVKDPNDDDDESMDLDALDGSDDESLGSATSIEFGGEIIPKEKVAYIRQINDSLHKSMHVSAMSIASGIKREMIWLSSFRRLDPRYKILSFFQTVAEQGVDKVVKASSMKSLKEAPAILSWLNRASAFSVWRPTSRDAIHKMMSGQATGKGLEIKGKSAKCGCLSALVPFIQIYEEQHKERIRECVRDKTMRVFFPTEQARDEAADMLNDVVEMMMFFVQDAMQMLANPEITEEQEKEVMKHLQWDGSDLGCVKLNDYAPKCYGVQISERLFWEGFVMMQDCSRPPGSKFETGRPSEPAFMDMNFKAVRHVPSDPGEPTPVVYQTDAEFPMSPRTLVVAYEEKTGDTGRVLPVVSDFDCFTVGTRGVKFDEPLPPDQVELVKWTVTNIESVLDQPFSADTWTKRWLEILKQAAIKGYYPKMPRFGFGDPKSYALMGKAVESLQDTYALMGKAVESLQDTGAVRHGAECFNYFFPQDLDDEFLVVSDTLPGGVPWKYVGVEELQEILLQKVDEGFTFPLNPKWVLCDPGWKRIYDKLMASDKRHVQDALKVWFPPESGIREHIEQVYAKHPNGFVRDTGDDKEGDDMDDMAAAELELEKFILLEGAKKKLRAVIAMIALANTLPSAIEQNRRDRLQRGHSYRAPKGPDRQMRRDAAMHRAMQLQEAAANRPL